MCGCVCVCVHARSQSCPALCDPLDCSLLGSSVHGIARQEYWSGWPFPSPGDLPDLGIKPRSPILLADSLLSEPPGEPIRYLFLIILEITVVKKKSAFYVCHDFNEKQIKINGYHLIMVTNYHPHGGLKQRKFILLHSFKN